MGDIDSIAICYPTEGAGQVGLDAQARALWHVPFVPELQRSRCVLPGFLQVWYSVLSGVGDMKIWPLWHSRQLDYGVILSEKWCKPQSLCKGNICGIWGIWGIMGRTLQKENNSSEINRSVVMCSCAVMLCLPESHFWLIGPLTFGLQTLLCF